MGVTPTDLVTQPQVDESGSIPEVGRKIRSMEEKMRLFSRREYDPRYDPNARDEYVEAMKKREHEDRKKREREEKDRRKKQR